MLDSSKLPKIIACGILFFSIIRSASKNLQSNFPKMNVLLNDLLYLAYFWVLGSISYQAKNSK